MNRIFIVLIISLLVCNFAYSKDKNSSSKSLQLPPLTGNVQENQYLQKNFKPAEKPSGFIKDSLSGNPIAGAEVSIPDKKISTYSNPDGSFKLNLGGQQGDFILSVKKQGYLPFALNAKKDDFSTPFTLHLEKNQGNIVIDSSIHHLGDNNYSDTSANAGSFRINAEGPTFTKEFYVESLNGKRLNLKIGSIIGLDTLAAKEIGQSNLETFSSPVSVYINSIKIAEIGINSSNKIIPIPPTVLKAGANNLLVVQTGINQLYDLANGLDYDDIEFMNLILQEN